MSFTVLIVKIHVFHASHYWSEVGWNIVDIFFGGIFRDDARARQRVGRLFMGAILKKCRVAIFFSVENGFLIYVDFAAIIGLKEE